MTENKARGLSLWALIPILIAASAGMGGLLGLYGETLGLSQPVRTLIIVMWALGIVQILRRRRQVTEAGPVLRWEMLSTKRERAGMLDSSYLTERARVPGGWLVISQFNIGPSHGLAFVPDPKHEWDGGSLP